MDRRQRGRKEGDGARQGPVGVGERRGEPHTSRSQGVEVGCFDAVPAVAAQGVGAQGGSVAELAPAFAPGRAAGLVSASRSIADAHETAGGEPAGAALAEAERLRREAWALG